MTRGFRIDPYIENQIKDRHYDYLDPKVKPDYDNKRLSELSIGQYKGLFQIVVWSKLDRSIDAEIMLKELSRACRVSLTEQEEVNHFCQLVEYRCALRKYEQFTMPVRPLKVSNYLRNKKRWRESGCPEPKNAIDPIREAIKESKWEQLDI